jgi:putative flippase GtrA
MISYLVHLGRRAPRLEAVRFVLTGVLNTIFGYSVYLALLFGGLPPVAALACATVIGAVFNYFTFARMVFFHRLMDRLPRFAGAYLIVFTANAIAMKILLGAGVAPALTQALLTPVAAAGSYFLFRTYVFPQVR